MKPAAATVMVSGGATAPWIAACALGAFMVAVDLVAPHILLPQIANYLTVSMDTARWVSAAYLAGLVGLLFSVVIARRVLVRRWSLPLAMLAFGLCSLLAGRAQELSLLVMARLLQGAAAGVLVALPPILAARLPSPGRSVALAAWAMALFTGLVSAPFLGGWISDNVSHRWLFLANVPLALLLAAILAIAPLRPTNAR